MLKKKPKQIQPTYQRNVYYPILITAFLNNPHLYEIAFIIIIISKKDLNIKLERYGTALSLKPIFIGSCPAKSHWTTNDALSIEPFKMCKIGHTKLHRTSCKCHSVALLFTWFIKSQ